MKSVLAGISLVALISTSAVSQEMSAKAQEVMDSYRLKLCKNATELLGEKLPKGYVPTFDYDESVYRKVRLAKDGITAELIYSSGMTCDGKHLGTCGSGGCSGHIIFNGHDYKTFGGPLFYCRFFRGRDRYENIAICGGMLHAVASRISKRAI